jgi:hypothetical protein
MNRLLGGHGGFELLLERRGDSETNLGQGLVRGA